ncbi:MAG: pH regulation protein F [Bacteroidetes bacterium]|jgi:multicomponent Na+:H+ antiporter subunit F|nr:pH regulation protein F [Bacteroidota bacterium]MBU1423108.1 pH regulation protein F [Bacteroidota bacterium]MBU2471287.1 pH regulation protein F [Bacteroidota bacterium]MBU2635795.1 pH regulation protein F [Bacteroidota bacterium]MDI6778726.1 monovalent cation/H+ antiporter complex subunit F [Bacteroidota bacterium]
MDSVFLIGTILLAIAIVIPFYRVAYGPTVYDRILGAGVIGTKTIVLISLVGYIFNRIDMFIDIVLAYALLNFIGTVAIAKLLESKGIEKE